MGAITAFAAVSTADWIARLACADDPQFANLLVVVSLGSAFDQGQLAEYLRLLGLTLSLKFGWYLNTFAPNTGYTSQILPDFWYPRLALVMSDGFAVLMIAGAAAFVAAAAVRWRALGNPLAVVRARRDRLFYFTSVVTRVGKEYLRGRTDGAGDGDGGARARCGSAWPLFARNCRGR